MAIDSTIYMEISFNIIYLIFIWVLVILMSKRQSQVVVEKQPIASRLKWGFFLLALGDSGHVGFRVVAYSLGGLEANATLVGIGSLSTGITITLLYMILWDVWRIRFQKPRNVLYYTLLAVGVVRFLLFLPAENQWANVVPPLNWAIYRNIPLIVQGLVAATFILVDAQKQNDGLYKKISYCIFASYVFYMPVIFFVQVVPMLGLLMIPKTIAYMVLAYFAYTGIFRKI
jgi:hypothetical protein